MKKLLRLAVLCLALAGLGWHTTSAQLAMVEGGIYSKANAPIPGLTVSLVHPVVGRSSPCMTNAQGWYVFHNVPARPEPYYFEVYWGTRLLYRNTYLVQGPRVLLPKIVL